MSAALAIERAPHPDDWHPNPGPQTRFLQLTCFEAMYGGQAGGGKSDALLIDAVRYVGRGYGRAYVALLLRRTFPELESSLILRSHDLYPRLGGKYNEQKKYWRFPGGERVLFGHLEGEKDVHRYQGSAFAYIGFDELTSFTEYQYLYLFSRCRSAAGIPCRIRSATNPGNVGHEWVKKRWFEWVSRDAKKPAASAEIRYFARRDDKDIAVEKGDDGALGRTHVPAKIEDNPQLAKKDPDYIKRLDALPALERARLRWGNWDKKPAQKDYWDRDKCGVLPFRPRNEDVVVRVRSWDHASSKSKKANATAGSLLALMRTGRIVIEHVVCFRGNPAEVTEAQQLWERVDRERDPRTVVTVPQDPGAAGVMVVAQKQRELARSAIEAVRPTGNKVIRFTPASSRQLAGYFDVVDDGSWDVEALHTECEDFPNGDGDDRVDTISDAYNFLAAYVEPVEDDEIYTFAAER